jgi:hypothetical protein
MIFHKSRMVRRCGSRIAASLLYIQRRPHSRDGEKKRAEESRQRSRPYRILLVDAVAGSCKLDAAQSAHISDLRVLLDTGEALSAAVCNGQARDRASVLWSESDRRPLAVARLQRAGCRRVRRDERRGADQSCNIELIASIMEQNEQGVHKVTA